MASSQRVWFITGGNSGFGLLLARLALSRGDTVIATARDVAKFPEDLRQSAKADLVEAQMTAPGTDIAKIIDSAVSRHGRIDVLVNNAGFGQMGAVEEVTEEEARYQFDVNFFGVLNFSRSVIPHMRSRGSGTIVQISSGVGLLGSPGAPVYSASKQAVEGLSEAMAGELEPFGIRVHIVEPGVFRTDFLGAISRGANVSRPKEGYVDIGGMLSGMHGSQPGNPELGVLRIYELVTGQGVAGGLGSQLRVPLGSDAMGMLGVKLGMLTETQAKLGEVARSTDF